MNKIDSGMRGLISAILRLAIIDYRHQQTVELEYFFKSNWCKSLCEALELNYNSVIDKVKEIKKERQTKNE